MKGGSANLLRMKPERSLISAAIQAAQSIIQGEKTAGYFVSRHILAHKPRYRLIVEIGSIRNS
jgi:hypothetical protein